MTRTAEATAILAAWLDEQTARAPHLYHAAHLTRSPYYTDCGPWSASVGTCEFDADNEITLSLSAIDVEADPVTAATRAVAEWRTKPWPWAERAAVAKTDPAPKPGEVAA